jgi:DNA-binding beta-propeller fold protein YncE
LTITPDANRLFAADGNSKLVSVVAPPRGQIGQITVGSDVRLMTMSPDGQRLYVGTSAAGVAVVEIATQRVVRQIPTVGKIFDQAITTDGKKLFQAMSHKGLWRMHTASGDLAQISDQECPEGVVTGPNQRLFVSYQCGGSIGRAGHDTVEILDSESEQRLVTITGPPFVASVVAPSPDGRTLLIDGGDACTRLNQSAQSVGVHIESLKRDREMMASNGHSIDTGLRLRKHR